MIRNHKRLLSLIPLLFLTSAASIYVFGKDLFLNSCQNQPTCGVIAKTLDWGDWLLGSSSTQFHFIDLLELLSTF